LMQETRRSLKSLQEKSSELVQNYQLGGKVKRRGGVNRPKEPAGRPHTPT